MLIYVSFLKIFFVIKLLWVCIFIWLKYYVDGFFLRLIYIFGLGFILYFEEMGKRIERIWFRKYCNGYCWK